MESVTLAQPGNTFILLQYLLTSNKWILLVPVKGTVQCFRLQIGIQHWQWKIMGLSCLRGPRNVGRFHPGNVFHLFPAISSPSTNAKLCHTTLIVEVFVTVCNFCHTVTTELQVLITTWLTSQIVGKAGTKFAVKLPPVACF